jgi:hypothetical protein
MVEIVFLMLVLKLPILYLVGVVWWAVRQEPGPPEPAALVPAPDRAPPKPKPDGPPRRPRRGGPHGNGRAERRPGTIRTR